MNPVARPISLRLRELKHRRLSQGSFLRELTRLADLGPDALTEMNRIADLRKRLATLEQQVRKLETRT